MPNSDQLKKVQKNSPKYRLGRTFDTNIAFLKIFFVILTQLIKKRKKKVNFSTINGLGEPSC
jgi:hypothetical protein